LSFTANIGESGYATENEYSTGGWRAGGGL
jgi:hypothetical protein